MDVAIIPVAVVTAVFAYFEIKKRLKKQPVIIKKTITESATVLKVEKSVWQWDTGYINTMLDFEFTLRVGNTELGGRNILVKQSFNYMLHPEVGDVVNIAVEVDDINKAVILVDNGDS
ncbi:hypothetical protein IDJ77_25180 [Mucilaginibacter sp. ZT4R22]|uniref:DUF3592 domain-containing protein n=1 Tax=Mucilaginibacter pankratovii TaxID=2772110 RepID=A0ABR7X087_9SPHI|nr:hypothetical protein [Mucilaginibacter pankratovii]MBD1367129.1 hypothetical protein [Mucilaginibacter pankratovii]